MCCDDCNHPAPNYVSTFSQFMEWLGAHRCPPKNPIVYTVG